MMASINIKNIKKPKTSKDTLIKITGYINKRDIHVNTMVSTFHLLCKYFNFVPQPEKIQKAKCVNDILFLFDDLFDAFPEILTYPPNHVSFLYVRINLNESVERNCKKKSYQYLREKFQCSKEISPNSNQSSQQITSLPPDQTYNDESEDFNPFFFEDIETILTFDNGFYFQ